MEIGEGSQGDPEQAVGGFDPQARAWVLGLFGAGGAVLAAVLPLLSRWAAGLPWMPFQGPLALLGSSGPPWLGWGRPVIGLAAGLLFAGWVVVDSPVLLISRERIRVQRGGQVRRVIERAKVDGVYRQRSKIVIEAVGGRTLFEGDVEGDKAAVRRAFVDHGHPWEGPQD